MKRTTWWALVLGGGLVACSGDKDATEDDADTDSADADADTDADTDTDTDTDTDADADADADTDTDTDTDADTDTGLPCWDVDAGSTLPTAYASTTEGAGDDYELSCYGGGSNSFEDYAVQWAAPADGTYTFRLTQTLSSMPYLAAYDGCGGVELACTDMAWRGFDLTLTVGQSILLVVDQHVSDGEFNLEIEAEQDEMDCANALDDDENGYIDCADPDCSGVASCQPQCPDQVAVGFPALVTGTSAGSPDESTGSCGSYFVFYEPDQSIEFTAPSDGLYGFALSEHTREKSLYLLDGCGGAELACDYDAPTSNLTMEMTAGQTVVAVVDGFPWYGDYELAILTPNATDTCGDGFDDDFDGLSDCWDEDCAGDPTCVEDCANGFDDDADFQVDCTDADCQSSADCVEDCINGLDDDDDYLSDCADPYCDVEPLCIETDCTNSIDDDGSGLMDCSDPDCGAEPACASICPEETLSGPLPIEVFGTTLGRNDDQTLSCILGTADYTYTFTAPADGDYTFDTYGSSYTAALAVLDGCGGTELACDIGPNYLSQAEVVVSLTAGQTVLVVVDGAYEGNWFEPPVHYIGDFVLNISQ